jgi:aspartate aminotransferase
MTPTLLKPSTLKPTIADRISSISVSSTMKVMADADKLRREGIDVVDFSAGEPDFPTPDNIKQAAIRAINENFTKYTPAGGTNELKQAVIERHKAEFGTDYKVSETIISVGGKHVLFNYMQALVNPGDEVIIPVPYWVTYKDIVNYAGGKCVFVDTDEKEGFRLTAAMVERHITPRTRIVLINSPSNPAGSVLEDAEFEKLYHITSKLGIFLLTDECYSHFLYDGSPYSVASIPGSKSTVLVAGTVSKTYAMTGWRIGYALAPEPIIGAMMKLQSHSTSNPTSIAQKAAVEALRGSQDSVPQMLAEYRRRRDFVIPRLREIPGVECSMPAGAFYAYPNLRAALDRGGIKTPLEFADRLLKEANVAVVPGEAFGTDDHVRISYATSMEELKRGLDRIHRFVEGLPFVEELG